MCNWTAQQVPHPPGPEVDNTMDKTATDGLKKNWLVVVSNVSNDGVCLYYFRGEAGCCGGLLQ